MDWRRRRDGDRYHCWDVENSTERERERGECEAAWPYMGNREVRTAWEIQSIETQTACPYGELRIHKYTYSEGRLVIKIETLV